MLPSGNTLKVVLVYQLLVGKKEQMISLRAAARNFWNEFIENRCQCTTKCESKGCKCRRSRISCCSHCHDGKSCCNKKYEEKCEKENEVNINNT